jgi:hypothetical protein
VERDPARGMVQLVSGETARREEASEGQAGTTSVTRDAAARAAGHRSCLPHATSDRRSHDGFNGRVGVIGRPYTTAGGKTSHVRVQRVDKPGVTETRLWGSYEKVTVIRRATAEEGK